MTQPDQPVAQAPTCYRHPDRVTYVSCGRCGKPLCPDCLQHGPVGVRCAECLNPTHGRVAAQLAAPERVPAALGIAGVQALLWVIVLVGMGLYSGVPKYGVPPQLSPNLLLSWLAGAVVGWGIWRMCGGSSNRITAWWAFALGTAIPAVAAVLLAGYSLLMYGSLLLPWWQILLRGAVAAIVAGFFAWLLATQRRWDRDQFDQ